MQKKKNSLKGPAGSTCRDRNLSLIGASGSCERGLGSLRVLELKKPWPFAYVRVCSESSDRPSTLAIASEYCFLDMQKVLTWSLTFCIAQLVIFYGGHQSHIGQRQ